MTNRQTTLLECDVFRALGELVLDEPFWWHNMDLTSDPWKQRTRQIADRVTLDVVRDATAHVLNSITSLAEEVAKEATASDQEPRLSMLVAKWPLQFANAGDAIAEDRRVVTNEELEYRDPYAVVVWAILGCICKADTMAWPTGWGQSSCSCSSLRPLVDAVTDIWTAATLDIDMSESEVKNLAEKILTLGGTPSQWLREELGEVVGDIESHCRETIRFVETYLKAAVQKYRLSDAVWGAVVPASLPFSFIYDRVASTEIARACAAQVLGFGDGPIEITYEMATGSFRIVESQRMNRVDSTRAKLPPGGLTSVLRRLIPVVESRRVSSAIQYLDECGKGYFRDEHPALVRAAKVYADEKVSCASLPGRPHLQFRSPPRSKPLTHTEDQWGYTIIDIVDVELERYSSRAAEQEEPFRFVMHPEFGCTDIVPVALVFVGHTNVEVPEILLKPNPKRSEIGAGLWQYHWRSPMCSSYSDTANRIVRISAIEGRAVVLPSTSQYRIGSVQLVDPTQPGRFSVLRVAFGRHWSFWRQCRKIDPSRGPLSDDDMDCDDDRDRHSNLPIFKSQGEPTKQNWSAEEWRYSDWERHRELGYAKPKRPEAGRGTKRKSSHGFRVCGDGSGVGVLESLLSCDVSYMTYTVGWWSKDWADSESKWRQEWDESVEREYLHHRLGLQVKRQVNGVACHLQQRASKVVKERYSDTAKTRLPPIVYPQPTPGTSGFTLAAELYAHLSLLKELYDGNRGEDVPKLILFTDFVDFVRSYLKTEDAVTKTQLLGDLIGEALVNDNLVGRLNEACNSIQADWSAWLAYTTRVVEQRWLPAITIDGVSHDMWAPVLETSMCNKLVSPDTKQELLNSLEGRRRTVARSREGSNQPSSLKLVDPACRVVIGSSRYPPPTFGVPNVGSIDERLVAVWNRGAEPSEDGVHIRQWIPSDVVIDHNGQVRFLTYINDLYPPHHRDLYKCIEVVASSFVPMFEHVLGQLREPQPEPIFFHLNGNIVNPVDRKLNGAEPWPLRGRVVQMVVEIIEVQLTSESPRHKGERWHGIGVEAQTVEVSNRDIKIPSTRADVIATGTYFVQAENLTDVAVGIRRSPPIKHKPVFCESDQKPEKIIGYFVGIEDLCVVVPAMYAHQIDPFELKDESKPGTLLMVNLHLVNPSVPMVSTAVMQPTQRDWLAKYSVGLVSTYFALPTDLRRLIESMLECDGDDNSEAEAAKITTPDRHNACLHA